MLLTLAKILTVLFLPLHMLLQVATPAFTSGDPTFDLLTYGTAIGTTFALGLTKKYTGIADTWLGSKIKPVQPLLVGILSVAMPMLIHGTPNVPNPQALAVAPTATLLAVAAAEILRRVAGPARPLSP
jgi:hypothetical protein